MERLTKYITPVGKCMTTLNSMKHYMPCVPCRHKAEIKTDSKGNMYTEKFSFCDTCEVKMLFNKLKEYEDAEEQGLLLRLPCKVGDKIYHIEDGYIYEFNSEKIEIRKEDGEYIYCIDSMDYRKDDFGKIAFFTVEEAEQALARMEGENE